jgi:hypothetical protein
MAVPDIGPDTSARVAVIVTIPFVVPVTRPWLPAALLTVASGAEDAQLTDVVRCWVVWSE